MKASVSVVMPHYNSLGTIGRSIDSVVDQTMPVRELIIVDDGSESIGELSELVDRYSSRLDISLVSLGSNKGASYARNVGVSKASSKYIAFLDSDDVWHPEKVAIQYGYMEGGSFFLTGHGYVFDLSPRGFEALGGVESVLIGGKNFIWGNPFFTPTVMALREGFISFDERHRRVDDYKCWYENLNNGSFAFLRCNLAGGYKPPIGCSGLSGSVRLMHEGYLDVLRSLYVERKISLPRYLATLFFEFVKYPIRSALVRLRRK